MSYILNTVEDQKSMLATIGAGSMEELFRDIPANLRLKKPLAVPEALTEMELQQHMAELARRNRFAGDAVCFLGGGSYDHFIPAVVDAVASRSEYYTAYTPYQGEASQGSLQAFFEYQTLICQLTGLDVANASLYDGGSAVAESVLMAMSINPKRTKVLVAESVHPEYRLVLSTYLANLHMNVATLPAPDGFLDPDRLKAAMDDQTLCVIVQQPNFFGGLEEVETAGPGLQEPWSTVRRQLRPDQPGIAETAWGIRSRHRSGGGAVSRQPHGVRRTVSRHHGVPGRVRAQNSGPAGRADGRSPRQTLLGADAANARTAHSPGKGHEQYLHESGAVRSAGGGVSGRPGAAVVWAKRRNCACTRPITWPSNSRAFPA